MALYNVARVVLFSYFLALATSSSTSNNPLHHQQQQPEPPLPIVTPSYSYPSFLSNHDLTWSFIPGLNATTNNIPTTWYTGAWFGGGIVGGSVRWDPTTTTSSSNSNGNLRIDLARTDVWGCSNRQPIGWFTLQTVGVVTNVSMRLALVSNELTINVTTSTGTISSLLFADSSALVVVAGGGGNNISEQIISLQTTTTGGESGQSKWIYNADLTGACRHVMPVNESAPLNVSGSPYASAMRQYVDQGSYTTAFTIVPIADTSDDAKYPRQQQQRLVGTRACGIVTAPRITGITANELPLGDRNSSSHINFITQSREELLSRSSNSSPSSNNNYKWTRERLRNLSNVTVLRSLAPVGMCVEPIIMGYDDSAATTTSPPPTTTTTSTMFITMTNAQRTGTTSNASTPIALTALENAISIGFAALRASNAAWWMKYWSASFVSFDTDTAIEGLYTIQQARHATGGRAGMHDLLGVSGPGSIDLCLGPWCQYVWDMNVQVMPLMIHASNRNEILGNAAFYPFSAVVNASNPSVTWTDAFGSNFGDGDGLLWLSRSLQRHALVTADENFLSYVVYPILVMSLDQAGGTYAAYTKGSDGLYHVPHCYSPEFPGGCNGNQPYPDCTDCNYQLALRRWGLLTAISIATAINSGGGNNQPRLATWKDIVANLAPPPADANGLRISTEVPFYMPHRHYSHLLAIADLSLAVGPSIVPGDEQDEAIKGLDQWWNITCSSQQQRDTGRSRRSSTGNASSPPFSEQCRGFTQAGAATMSASLNRTDAAIGNLTALMNSVILPNGCYGEEVFAGHPDEFAPVSESAFAVASTIHEMLLGSWAIPFIALSGATRDPYATLRLWPGGATWMNVSFYSLRAEGGLNVSAVKTNGATLWVGITQSGSSSSSSSSSNSATGASSTTSSLIHVPDWSFGRPTPSVTPASTATIIPAPGQEGAYFVTWIAGTTVVVFPSDTAVPTAFTVDVAAGANTSEYNTWGFNRPIPPFH